MGASNPETGEQVSGFLIGQEVGMTEERANTSPTI
jgi:hypothetical protein